MAQPEIFDRHARRLVYNRASRSAPEDRWLVRRMGEELIDRLDAVRRPFGNALVIGHIDDALNHALQSRSIRFIHAAPGDCGAAIRCDEDRLPFRDRAFDLVLAINSLDTVNDLPGALILIRRALRPGGLFMGALAGAGSLPALRRALQGLDDKGAAISRLHPAIDVRAAGDLLGRAGFAMQVADNDSVVARYREPARLVGDLRANGLSNVLEVRRRFDRGGYERLQAHLAQQAAEEHFGLLYLTGWSPDI